MTVSTRVADVMTPGVIVVKDGQTYRQAIELLTSRKLTGLPVVDDASRLLGMITEKDILEACGEAERASAKFLDSRIRYRKRVRSIRPDAPISTAFRILSGKSYRHLAVTDEAGIVRGIITRRDLIRILYLRAELLNGATE